MTAGLYVKEIARVAKTYEIAAHVLIPADAASSSVEHLRAHGLIVETVKGGDFWDDNLLASAIVRTGAYRFPSHNEPDVVHGQGTVALELEEEVKRLLESEHPNQDGVASARSERLDAIINAMGNGSTLSGICMATQGTGTRVLGGETVAGSTANQSRQRDRETSCNYWHHYKPMGALPWSIFTSPRMLSAVFYVDRKTTELASEKLFEKHGIRVAPYDAAPLGLVLYSEDFRHFAAKEAASGHVRNIGIILRSDVPKFGEDLAQMVGSIRILT